MSNRRSNALPTSVRAVKYESWRYLPYWRCSLEVFHSVHPSTLLAPLCNLPRTIGRYLRRPEFTGQCGQYMYIIHRQPAARQVQALGYAYGPTMQNMEKTSSIHCAGMPVLFKCCLSSKSTRSALAVARSGSTPATPTPYEVDVETRDQVPAFSRLCRGSAQCARAGRQRA